MSRLKIYLSGTLLGLLILLIPGFLFAANHFFVTPGNVTVKTGESVTLTVMVIDTTVVAAVPAMASPKEFGTYQWQINEKTVNASYSGPEGSLQPLGAYAMYTAPISIPKKNPVQVSVRVPGEEGTPYQFIIVTIKVVDAENCFLISGSDCIPNGMYIQKTQNYAQYGNFEMSTAIAIYKPEDNILAITSSGVVDNLSLPPVLVLWVNGKGKGHYPWKINKKDPDSQTPECGITLTVQEDPMHMKAITNIDCHPLPDGSCPLYTLMGYTHLNEVKDGYITGFYDGKIMWAEQNGKHFMNITGNFKAKLQDIPTGK